MILVVSLVVWGFRRTLPEVGRPGRLIRFGLLPIAVVAAVVGAAYLVGLVPFSISELEVSAAGFIVGLVLLAFTAGRVFLLRRRGTERPVSICVGHTVQQSFVLLGKVLLVAYFVILLGQLSFRADATKKMHAVIVNEVQTIMSVPESPAGGTNN